MTTTYKKTGAAPRMSSLTSALVDLDRRASSRKGWNPYALRLYLEAADDCAAMVAEGSSCSEAFAECFTPSRDMHAVARKLALPLDVERGQWVFSSLATDSEVSA